ncbi:MAG: hypothetical protein ACE5ED_03115 [Rhodothalassiaceae bacterium]
MIATDNRGKAWALLLQRLALAAFMTIWALDKFIRPEHAAGVFGYFYGIPLAESLTWLVGTVQLLVIAAFALGFMKTWSYLLLLLFHAFGTATTLNTLAHPYGEGSAILFWAAVPVLAAFWTQFALRHEDVIALDDRLRNRATLQV